MFREHRAVLLNDFHELRTVLQDQGRFPDISPELEATVKRVHQLAYSLMLWEFRMDGIEPRGYIYLADLASDAMQFLPQCLLGYSRTPMLLARGILESTLRHVYFLDHPIEFARLGLGNFHATVSDLLAYLGEHPDFKAAEFTFDGRAHLATAYGELSEHVHGVRSFHEDVRLSPLAIELDALVFAQQAKVFEHVARACNFALSMVHRRRMRSWLIRDRLIVLRTMPKQARLAIAEADQRSSYYI